MSYSVEATLKATGATAFTKNFKDAAASVQKFKDVGSQMKSVGSTMTKAITLPLAGMGAAVIATGATFDDKMSTVQAVTQATGAEMDKMREQAKDLGSNTRFSASEAADGMEMLSRAGFDTSETMDAIPNVLDLAAAGAVGLGDAADITSNILSGFGMEASETGRIADVLAQASADANTDVQGLGEAFKYVGPIASGVGLSVEDTAAAIGILGDAGIQGGQAGNMLKRGLLNMSAEAGPAADKMEELGIEVFNSNGEMKTMPEILEQLEGGLEGMTEQQRLAALETIFGAEAVSGWSKLIDAGSDNLGDFSLALENSQGAAAKMAEIMDGNLMGSLREIKSNLEGLAISIYEILLPALQTIADHVLIFVQRLNNLSPAAKTVAVAFAAVAAAIGPLLVTFGIMISFVGMVATHLGTLSQRFAPLIARSTLLRTGISVLSRVFAMLVNPITGIIILITSMLIPLFTTLYQTNEQFRAIVQSVWTTVKTVISTVVTEVVSFVMQMWTELTAFWEQHGQMILQAAQNVWNVIKTVISTTMTVIGTVMKAVWPVVEALVISTWNAIKGAIQGAISVITGIIQAFSALFTGNWSALWDAVKQIVSGAVKLVWNLIQLWFVGKILKAGKALFNGLRSIVSSMWSSITGLFRSATSAVRSTVSNAFNAVKNKVSSIMNSVRSFISSIWNSIRSTIQSVLSSIRSTVSSIWNAIMNVIRGVLNSVRSLVSSIWNSIRSTIQSVLSSIRSVISSIWNAIMNVIRNILNQIKNTVRNIFNSLRGVVSSAFNRVKSAVKNGITGALNTIKGMFGKFLNAGKNIAGSIADGIKGAIGKVKDAIGNVTEKIRDFLPFSPAKEGALRDIMDIQIAESIAQTIDKGKRTAVRSMQGLTDRIHSRMPDLSMQPLDIAGQVNSINKQASRKMDNHLTSEVNVSKQPINVYVEGDSEWIRAYVNEQNAVDATLRRF